MNMHQHILAALSEQFNRWEELLASLSEAQMVGLTLPSQRSIKDDLAHLMAWQQRSIARVEAALLNREPEFPQWPPALDPEAEDVDQINAWIDETYRERPWSTVYQYWSEGFRRFLALSERVSEKDLLDSGRYSWLEGHSLVTILLGSYDHHQEHLEKLLVWLQEQKNLKP